MSGVSTSSAKRGWLRSTRFRRLDHLVIVGYMDQPCHLGAFRHFTKVLLWRLPHPIHLSCISNPLTLGELRTASEHRFPHFHPCHRRIASVCPADGQAVPGHSEHAARRAVALGGSTTLAVSRTFLNAALTMAARQAALPAVTGRGLDMEAFAKSAASSLRIIPIRRPSSACASKASVRSWKIEPAYVENVVQGTSSLPPSRPLLDAVRAGPNGCIFAETPTEPDGELGRPSAAGLHAIAVLRFTELPPADP